MLKWQKCHGGEARDNFNTVSLLLLGLFNVTNIVLDGRDLLREWTFTLPFFLLALFIYNIKFSKITKSIMFLAIGVFYHLSMQDPSGIGATSFIGLSFSQTFNKMWSIVLISVSLFLIVIKSTLEGDTPSQLVMTVLAFIYILGNFYKVYLDNKGKMEKLKLELDKAINGETEPIKNIDTINISQEEKAILRLYCEGYDYDKIQRTLDLNISPNTVRRKITGIKKSNKDRILIGRSKDTNINDAQFGKWLYQKV